MTYYEAGLIFAIAGIVFTRLQEPDEIFDFIPGLWEKGSIFRKLFGCHKCVAGQLALWTLLINGIINKHGWDYVAYSIITIILSIFLAMIMTLIIDKLE